MIQIRCRDLSVGYDGKTVASGLNFEICSGDYFCIAGQNGSGKTTLMKTLLRLLPPVKGNILTEKSLNDGGIGYLPQQTPVQKDFPASVREIVLSGCQGMRGLRPFYSRIEKALAEVNMEKMGVHGLSERCYRELSGGQQQRVLLARALCAAKKILLLDEPVSGLDPGATEEMYGLLAELNKKDDITIVMISHDRRAVLDYADRVLHIGSVCFFGTKEKYLQSGPGREFLYSQGGKAYE